MTVTSHEGQYAFLIISRSILLIVENIWDKSVDKIKAYILFFNNFVSKSLACSSPLC